MRIYGDPRSLATELQAEFGYIVIGTDDQMTEGEFCEFLRSQSVMDTSAHPAITSETDYADYAKQAEWAGFGKTCTDCFKHYYKARFRASVEPA